MVIFTTHPSMLHKAVTWTQIQCLDTICSSRYTLSKKRKTWVDTWPGLFLTRVSLGGFAPHLRGLGLPRVLRSVLPVGLQGSLLSDSCAQSGPERKGEDHTPDPQMLASLGNQHADRQSLQVHEERTHRTNPPQRHQTPSPTGGARGTSKLRHNRPNTSVHPDGNINDASVEH